MFRVIHDPDGAGSAELNIDPTSFDDDGLVAHVRDMNAVIAEIEAARVAALGEIEARKLCGEVGGLTTRNWLAKDAVLPRWEAKWRAETGARLRVLPELQAAVDDGRVNLFHARFLAEACFHPRVADEARAMLGQLIGLAVDTTNFELFRRRLNTVIALLDMDGGYDPDKDRENNQLSLSRSGDTVYLKGRFSGLLREMVEENLAVLLARLEEKFQQDRDNGDETPASSSAALRAQALADALADAVDNPDRADGPNAHVTVIVNPDNADQPIYSPRTGNGLSQAFLTFLAVHARWQALHLDEHGNPLNMGRAIRMANREQRRALLARDGGCVIAGCRSQHRLIAHHVRYWDDDGRTDIANLVLVCRFHHRRIHQEQWQAIEIGPQQWMFKTRTGHHIHTQRHFKDREPPERKPPKSDGVSDFGDGCPSDQCGHRFPER